VFKRFLGRQGDLFKVGEQLGIKKRVHGLQRRIFLFFEINFEGETSFIWNNNYKLKQ